MSFSRTSAMILCVMCMVILSCSDKPDEPAPSSWHVFLDQQSFISVVLCCDINTDVDSFPVCSYQLGKPMNNFPLECISFSSEEICFAGNSYKGQSLAITVKSNKQIQSVGEEKSFYLAQWYLRRLESSSIDIFVFNVVPIELQLDKADWTLHKKNGTESIKTSHLIMPGIHELIALKTQNGDRKDNMDVK